MTSLIHFVTIGSDEKKMEYLKKSADIKNLNITYITVNWRGFIDKIICMINFIKDYNDNDIICFIDAYDVIVSNIDDIYKKFIDYNCDILFSSEFICFPYDNIEKYNILFKDTKYNTNFKYLNSGGYIGYKKDLYKMLISKPVEEINKLCKNGGDQNFFTQYYLNNINEVKLDINQEIFQSMCCVDFYEFEIHNGFIYNKCLDRYPCFIHFNGFGDDEIKTAFFKKNHINIIEETLNRIIFSIHGDIIHLPYEQFDKKYIEQI